MKWLLLFLGILFLTSPAMAILTNNTANQNYYFYNTTLISGSYLHDQNYMPREYVILIILLGIIFWILAIATDICQDLFSILAPCFFGAATWYCGYMTKETLSIVINTLRVYTVHSQIITPEPVLQLLCFLLTVFSALSAVYVIFLRGVDKQTDRQQRLPEE